MGNAVPDVLVTVRVRDL